MLFTRNQLFSDVGYEHKVTLCVGEGSARVQRKGKDAPVDAVGSVSLGCKFVANVGKAAKHLLAGCSLLACRAVTGFVGKQARAELRVLRQRICIAYARESLAQLFGDLARSAVFFLRGYRLGK